MFNAQMLKFIVLPGLLSFSVCANAQGPQDFATQFSHAINFINGQLGTIDSVQTPPPLSDPETRASYETVGKTMEKFGTESFPVNGLESMEAICGPISEAMMKHSFIGTSALKSQQLAADVLRRKLSQMMVNNSHAYQNEIMILTAAHVHCSAAHVPEMSKFIQNLDASELTDIRKDGLRKMGSGTINMLLGLATYAADPAMSVASKNQAMALAVKYAPELIVMTSLADRKSALTQFDAAKPYIPKPYLEQFSVVRDAFTNQNCSILCIAQD